MKQCIDNTFIQQGEWVTVQGSGSKCKPPVLHKPPVHTSNRFSHLSNTPAEKFANKVLIIGDCILRNVKVQTPTTTQRAILKPIWKCWLKVKKKKKRVKLSSLRIWHTVPSKSIGKARWIWGQKMYKMRAKYCLDLLNSLKIPPFESDHQMFRWAKVWKNGRRKKKKKKFWMSTLF